MVLLDPKLDVVFKMLFAAPPNRHLLASLLTAVLRPPSPIAKLTVLDPELPKELATDRGVRLDVLVALEDGTHVDVEMECDPRRGRGERWLYHWARLYSARIRRGDEYERLEPVVCIVFLDATSPSSRFHSIYEAREIHSSVRLSECLAIHVLELPRVGQAPAEGESADLERWARFLRFDGSRALESLAAEAPIMADAKEALEILSREPSAQRIAEMRREGELARRLDRAEDLAEGREQGLSEGREQGLSEGQRRALLKNIETFCAAFDIELAAPRRMALEAASDTELEAMFEALVRQRAWPER